LLQLGDLKNQVIIAGSELEASIYDQVATFVDETIKDLEGHSCQIALIGQINAGKSSLANALIMKPDFLPTDINPTTAVVTKLFLGAPQEKHNTAEFHFFTDAEWSRIMTGGRFDLPSARGPAHLLETARAKLADFETQVKSQLGSDYRRHLGKNKLLQSITGEEIAQYISATDQPVSHPNLRNRALFSGITKSAEIFLKENSKGYSTIVIDTPGINDPFFVRDEITHANLASADVYIVVLTAQQPLSESDMSLIRMLRGLQRDKIIAVINRLDTLPYTADADGVALSVTQRLRQEFPNSMIPVVMVSAAWANAAIKAHLDREIPPFINSAATFALRAGIWQQTDVDAWRSGSIKFPDEIAEKLYQLSGVPRLIANISKLVGNSVTEEKLIPITSTLSAIAENTATSLRFGLSLLSNTRSRHMIEKFRFDQSKLKVKDRIQHLEQLIAQARSLIHDAEAKSVSDIDRDLSDIEKYMIYTVKTFADTQSKHIIEQSFSPRLSAKFLRETLRLRSELAEGFTRYHTDIAKNLISKQSELEDQLRKSVKQLLPTLDNVVQYGVTSNRTIAAPLISMSQVTAFDLDNYWENMQAQVTYVGGDKVATLSLLIQSEFLPLIKSLINDSGEASKAQVKRSLRRVLLMTYSVIYPFVRQLHDTIIEDKNRYSGHDSYALTQSAPANVEEITNSWEKELKNITALAERLKHLKKQCFVIAGN
jgi:cellulose biosynthesis protein BcsQ